MKMKKSLFFSLQIWLTRTHQLQKMWVNNEKGQNEKLLPLRWTTSNNFAANEWHSLQKIVLSLSSFKRHPSKVTFKSTC